MTDYALLTRVVRRSVVEEQVEVVFFVVVLDAVVVMQVPGINGGVRAGSLYDVSGSQRFGPCEVSLHGQAMPVGDGQLQEAGIIVAVAVADGGGERWRLATDPEGGVEGIANQSPTEVKHPGAGDTGPGIVRVRDIHVARVVHDEGSGAIGEAHAVGWVERFLKEWLRCDRGWNVGAVVGGHHDVLPGVREALPVDGHHVGDDAYAVILDFIRDFAADVASFGQDLRTELVLDIESEFVRAVGLEIRVEGFARSGRDPVDAGIPRLWQVLNRQR